MKKNLGFTLVELLVVISIIGVLAGLLMTNFVGIRGRAEDAGQKSDVVQLRKALQLYYNDFQSYPAVVPGSGEFNDGAGTIYMKAVPSDFSYYVSVDGEEFLLVTTLNNVSDDDAAASQSRCNPDARSYYTDGPVAANEYVVCED